MLKADKHHELHNPQQGQAATATYLINEYAKKYHKVMSYTLLITHLPMPTTISATSTPHPLLPTLKRIWLPQNSTYSQPSQINA